MSGATAALSLPVTAPAFRAHPAKLYVEATSRCNLNCVMCMKQHGAGGRAAEGDLAPATFQALEPALPYLDSLVLNGVGEPLLNPRLEQYVARAKSLMPSSGWVGFQSNGLLLNNLRAVSLASAGLDRICLSMDGVHASTFSSIRAGSQLADLEHALASLDHAKKLCGRPDLAVGVEFVVMRDNLAQLPAALDWAANRGAGFAIVSHLHPFDESHQDNCSYDLCSDQAIALFQNWRIKAELKGLDFGRYFEVLWKYRKTPQERSLIALVAAMKGEALERGITLDLKRLLELDYARLAQTEQIFAEAARVAERTGLDLRLPEITRREERGCSFVEQGAAFVSWDGAVHPCYQLWHACRSHANGWQHPVQPRVFGRVPDQGLLEIWNGGPFSGYRENVLRRSYPSCSECSLSPCDLVQQQAFSEDCFANQEPCGSCLWRCGVFRCLE